MQTVKSLCIPFTILLFLLLPDQNILGNNTPNTNPPCDTEICDNGIDDDQDGLIDCYDPDCCGNTICEDYYYNECPVDCSFEPSNTTFQMTIDWTYSGGDWHPYTTAITGDIDGDGMPEVIGKKGPYTSPSPIYKDLLILDGQTGALEATIPTEYIAHPMSSVTIADINKNGFAEIIVIVGESTLNTFSRYMFCYEFDGTNYQQLWMSDVATGYQAIAASWSPSVADFNQDGIAEVYVLNEIYDGLTGKRLLKGTGNLGQGSPQQTESMVVAADVLPDSFCPTCDGLELIAGGQAYAVHIDPLVPTNNSITIAAQAPVPLDGSTAIADMDRDGDLDAVFTYPINNVSNIYIWDIQTSTALAPVYSFPGGATYGWVGLPNIADVDGNGTLELGVCGISSYRVVSYNPSGLIDMWSVPTTDVSGRTGTIVFDFEGDGDKEIAYRDQDNLRIFDGTTGTVLYTIPCTSGTGWEYPVVVDVDNDGETELLCSCDDELHVYKSASVPWEPTRSVWNQHAFFNVNINDDLTVPSVQQQQQIVGDSLVLNSFLNPYSDPVFPAANASIDVNEISCSGDSLLLEVSICNTGDNTLPANMPIAFYDFNPLATPGAVNFYTAVTNRSINQDSCYQGIVTIPAIFNSTIYMIVNDDGSIPPVFDLATDFPSTSIAECDYTDNINIIRFDYTQVPLDLGADMSGCHTEFTLNAGPEYVSYNWSDGSTDTTFTANTTGNYWVEVADECANIQTDTALITISNIACSVLVLQDVTVNSGNDGSATASASNGIQGYTYTWSDGQTTAVASGLRAGSYTVSIVDNIGCKAVCTIEIAEPGLDCEPCYALAANDIDICAEINGDPSHPWASLDCDSGGVDNVTECLNAGDPEEASDDCSIALISNSDICMLINNDPDHPLAEGDCDLGGIPNLLECQNNGDPSDPADECTVAIAGQLNICRFIDYLPDHPLSSLDCDLGGVDNYTECINGLDASEANDDCVAAVRGSVDICLLIDNDPNHPWASLDCDLGGIINIVECMNGADPAIPSDDLFCPPNLCAEAIVGDLDICQELSTDPNHPVGTLDCDGDGVTNADECTDGTNPLDPCDFDDMSITLPVTADQSDCPFPCQDLSPIMTILPGNIAGQSAVEVAVKITELDSVDTNGSIIIARIPSDPRLVFVWDIGLTMAALVPVQNADWNYLGDNGFVHTWTYNGPGLMIPADGSAAFGFQSVYDPQSTDGQTTLTVTVLPFSGGECNILNNTDSERLVYFQ